MKSFVSISAILIIAHCANGNPSMFDSVLHGATQALGTVENAVSPSAMRSFCNQNGYTVWVGSGPEPTPDSAIGSAWSAWGTITGAGFGALASAVGGEAGIQGKCDASGWAKPESLNPSNGMGSSGSSQITILSNPSGPTGSTTQYYPGQPGSQTTTTQYYPGTPSTTTQYYPGQPGSQTITTQNYPGKPSTTTQYYPGQPGSQTITTQNYPGTPSTTTQYYPGQPGSQTTTSFTPGRSVQYSPGQTSPSISISKINPPPKQCLCPCSS